MLNKGLSDVQKYVYVSVDETNYQRDRTLLIGYIRQFSGL